MAAGSGEIRVQSTVPRRRQELLKWYGWGYKDSSFKLQQHAAVFTGDRYQICGQALPDFLPWVKEVFCVDVTRSPEPPPPPPPAAYPPSRLSAADCAALRALAPLSTDGLDRLLRAASQTLRDVATLRRLATATGPRDFPRIPDAVVWPDSHASVERIVAWAVQRGAALLPRGGGTSVSGAATCPAREERPLVALDTSDMNAILWLDAEQLVARCQAGVTGQDLERELRARGLTVGHEPDSLEFSTLGGWVATRASGMKKNAYGNIEELVVGVRAATPAGTLERACGAPRVSAGPDWLHVLLGSEGCLGVVTEVTLKLRPLPPATRYGALVFPDWERGVHFAREVARRRLQPASLRLLDNEQFRFGRALRPARGWRGAAAEAAQRAYLTRLRGLDLRQLVAVTLVFEGSARAVREHERRLARLAARYGGLAAGAEHGERGYTLTFVIAYIRDLALDYKIVAESFETSVAWDRARALAANVKRRLAEECGARGIAHFLASCRLTQTYDAGCCLYFYFAFNGSALADPVAAYEEIEERARDEIIASGGSISHHHGVGKLRRKWYTQTVSAPGRALLLAAKRALDPTNVFALGNLALHELPERARVRSRL